MRRFAVVSIATLVALLALSEGTRAADLMFLAATGQAQGDIKGSVTVPGFQEHVKVIQYAHDVIAPRDPQTGLPTGQRMHKPLVLRIAADKALPLFYTAFATNENLSSVDVKFVRETTKNLRTVFTVHLTNANIASVSMRNPDSAEAAPGSTAEIAFTYQTIRWTWGGATAEDGWLGSVN